MLQFQLLLGFIHWKRSLASLAVVSFRPIPAKNIIFTQPELQKIFGQSEKGVGPALLKLTKIDKSISVFTAVSSLVCAPVDVNMVHSFFRTSLMLLRGKASLRVDVRNKRTSSHFRIMNVKGPQNELSVFAWKHVPDFVCVRDCGMIIQ